MSPSPPELFPQRPVRSDFGRAPSYRLRRIITISVVVVALAVGARMIFGSPFPHSGEIATIKAEGAWKQRPEQPGGIDIPNQDVRVYQSLDNKDSGKPVIEHLLAPPETPQPVPTTASPSPNASVPALAAPPSASSGDAPQIESLAPPKLDIDTIATTVSPSDSAPAPAAAPAPSPVAVASVVAAPAVPPPTVTSTPSPAATTPVAVNPAPAVVAPPKPSAPAKAKPLTMEQVIKDAGATSKTSRIVQFASMQDQPSAQAMAEKLQSRYASVLGTASLRVVEADVAGKGIYYRIQSPPLSADRASGICDAVKKMKAGCILVRP